MSSWRKMAAGLSEERSRLTVKVPVEDPIKVYRSWWRALSDIDPRQPPEGFDGNRWHRLYDCSVWWFDGYARQAAQDGWTTSDVFGLYPAAEGHGGLIDRLGEVRRVDMHGDRAEWVSWGVPDRYRRGSMPELRPFWVRMGGPDHLIWTQS